MNRAIQKQIFGACRQLGINTEMRRDLQLLVTGKASMSDMTDAEMKRVLARLRKDGAKLSSGKKKHQPAPRADLRLVHVLWRKLGEANKLKDPSRKGLNTFIRSRFEGAWTFVPLDVDMLSSHKEIDQVIQALKSWGKRADIDFDWSQHQR